jgi:hypothetical protein
MAKHEPTRQALRIEVGNTAVIRPARTKHGPRQSWGALEFAQLAIQALYGANPPKHRDRNLLTDEVNEWLRNDPDWRSTGRHGGISQPTILRALKMVRP